MASHLQLLPVFLLLILLPSAFSATFLLPVFKTTDHARPQYHTRLRIGTPPTPVILSIDLTNAYTWFACDLVGYTRRSTSYSVVHCNTSDCDAFSGTFAACIDCSDPPTPSCNLNQCASLGTNPVSLDAFLDPIVRDTASLYRLAATTPPSLTSLPSLPVSCVTPNTLKGLSNSSNGILTLARAPIAFQSQVSSSFNVPRKFAVCLPSSSTSGAVYFGGGPYSLPPNKLDLSQSMVKVPLLVNGNSSVNRFDLGDPSIFYYIKVSSISIDGSPVGFNSSLLSFDAKGNGGTMVSTIAPYSKLHSQIFKPFVELFVAKAKALNVKTVKLARKDFGACFDPKSIKYDASTGSGLPVIDLALEGGKRWRIFGSNSIVKVKTDAWCLAFVDGGTQLPRSQTTGVTPAVVIGGVQMEDNLVEFDLEASKLGVTSSLLGLGTSCSQFKGL